MAYIFKLLLLQERGSQNWHCGDYLKNLKQSHTCVFFPQHALRFTTAFKFLIIMSLCVMTQVTLCFASNHRAICLKLPCNLRQVTLCFASGCVVI